MTLLVAAACRNFVVLAADRRLIWERGMPYEEFTKAGVLLCEDGRMAYGLASDLAAYGAPGGAPAFPSRTGEFNAGEWAVKNLVEASDGDKRIRPTLETFTERATREWQKWPVPSRTKRTEFMFAGLEYEIDESSADADGEPKHAIARPTVATVTNISSDGKRSEPEFRLELERPGTHYMVLGGNHWAVQKDAREYAMEALPQCRKHAVVSRCVHLIRSTASLRGTKGSIGKQFASIVIPTHMQRKWSCEYHTESASVKFIGVFVADCVHGIVHGAPTIMQVAPNGKATPIAGPNLPKNAPCWCGGGERYGNCHGSKRGRRRPRRNSALFESRTLHETLSGL